jgi:hypothetical protein
LLVVLGRGALCAFLVALLPLAGLASLPEGRAAVAPSSGLVAYWSFDDGSGSTAADGSGGGRTGTLTYGPTWAASASCKVGGCVSLDGVDDYVKVADATALRLTGDVTVSAWIKPAGLGGKRSVVSKRYEFELGHIHDTALHPLKWTHKGSGGSVVSGDLASSTEAGAWQHVVLVRDAASRRMRGYKDGAPALSGSYTVDPGTSSYNVNIGRNPSGAQHFRGLIDEVRIYDRVLTEDEIAALYSYG